jgi:hypothetical protein
MVQDLAAVAPSAIVCAAFLIGVGMLLRREMAPKWRARAKADDGRAGRGPLDRDEGSES